MTGEQKAALRALAEKATPGPWVHAKDMGHIGSVEIMSGACIVQVQALKPRDGERRDIDAAYIAAANPAAVLALLDEVERLKGALRLSLNAWATTGVSNGAIREAQEAALVALKDPHA